jgi:HSP20 family protein
MFFTSPYSASSWEPLHLLDRLLAETAAVPGGRLPVFASSRGPAMNVWADADQLHVTAEVPGIDPDKIAINVLGDTLTISGKRGEGAEASEFTRSFQLPYRVDAERTTAQVRDGVLAVTLQRPEAEKARRIAVATA